MTKLVEKWWFRLVDNPWLGVSLMVFCFGLVVWSPVVRKGGRVVCLGISWIVWTHKILQPSPNKSYQHHICHFQRIHFHPFPTVESSPLLGQATVVELPQCSNVHVRMEGPSALSAAQVLVMLEGIGKWQFCVNYGKNHIGSLLDHKVSINLPEILSHFVPYADTDTLWIQRIAWSCPVLGGNKDRENGLGFPTVLRELECLTQLLTATIQEIVVTHLESQGRRTKSDQGHVRQCLMFDAVDGVTLHLSYQHSHIPRCKKKRCNIWFFHHVTSLWGQIHPSPLFGKPLPPVHLKHKLLSMNVHCHSYTSWSFARSSLLKGSSRTIYEDGPCNTILIR